MRINIRPTILSALLSLQLSPIMPIAPVGAQQPPMVHATVPWVRNLELEKIVDGLNSVGWQGSAIATGAETDPDRLAILAEYGCQARIGKSFQRGQRRIDVVVYQFMTSQGAYGAYNFFRKGASNLLVKGDASSEDDQSISVWKDRYYISVAGTSQDDDESKALVSSLMEKLIAAVPGHSDLPPAVVRLPGIDKIKGSERIVMGPLTARRLFPAPSLSLLSFDTSSGGVVADYATQVPSRERMKLLAISYPNPATAAAAYYAYIKEVSSEHPNLSNVSESSLFKTANTYLSCELRGNQVIVVSGSKKKTAALLLSHEMN